MLLALLAGCHLTLAYDKHGADQRPGDGPADGTTPSDGRVSGDGVASGDGATPGDGVIPSDSDGASLTGDLDGDGDVDRDDIAIIDAERGKTVAESSCGAPCDINGDGVISLLDSRSLVALCTRPLCVTEDDPADGGSDVG